MNFYGNATREQEFHGVFRDQRTARHPVGHIRIGGIVPRHHVRDDVAIEALKILGLVVPLVVAVEMAESCGRRMATRTQPCRQAREVFEGVSGEKTFVIGPEAHDVNHVSPVRRPRAPSLPEPVRHPAWPGRHS